MENGILNTRYDIRYFNCSRFLFLMCSHYYADQSGIDLFCSALMLQSHLSLGGISLPMVNVVFLSLMSSERDREVPSSSRMFLRNVLLEQIA